MQEERLKRRGGNLDINTAEVKTRQRTHERLVDRAGRVCTRSVLQNAEMTFRSSTETTRLAISVDHSVCVSAPEVLSRRRK